MREQWTPAPGYEGIYEVSDQGNVRSLDRFVDNGQGGTSRLKGKTLKPGSTPTGYLFVYLCVEGKPKRFYVHRLVMAAFVGNAPPEHEVCHWNDIKTDNRLENLRYGTRSENRRDLIRNGRHAKVEKTHCPRGHLLAMPNLVASGVAAGHRSCLACDRASAYLRYYPGREHELEEVSNHYYQNILKEEN